MVSANALIRLAFSVVCARYAGYGGPPEHIGIGAVCFYARCLIGVKKGSALLVVVVKVLTGILQAAAWLLLFLVQKLV